MYFSAMPYIASLNLFWSSSFNCSLVLILTNSSLKYDSTSFFIFSASAFVIKLSFRANFIEVFVMFGVSSWFGFSTFEQHSKDLYFEIFSYNMQHRSHL